MRPSVELSLIVKDGARTLARCLESARGVVDRIVVGDTGSTDETVAIARSFGAEVFATPWTNDFAAARNHILRQARCDWVLVLDADEMLGDDAGGQLPALLGREDIAAYEVWIWNYVLKTNTRCGNEGTIANPGLVGASRAYPAYVRNLNTRLFRRDPGIVFERAVHESVTPSLKALGLRTGSANFVIHHFGHAEDPAVLRDSKNELYQQIGIEHLRAHPDDPRAHLELGLGELEHFRNPEAALPRFLEAIRLDPGDPAPFLFAGMCLIRLDKLPEALELLAESARLDPASIVLHETIGDAYFRQTDYAAARRAYERALALGATSALIEAKLGACEVHRGEAAGGLARVERALAREPHFAELYDMASATAILARKPGLAADWAAARLDVAESSAFHFALAVALSNLAHNFDRAQALLGRGLACFPDDPELRRALRESSPEPLLAS